MFWIVYETTTHGDVSISQYYLRLAVGQRQDPSVHLMSFYGHSINLMAIYVLC